MKSAPFAGAVSDDGENLRVVTRDDLETLPPGVYSLGENRTFTGRAYCCSVDIFTTHQDDSQEAVARISDLPADLPVMTPDGSESAYYRASDGKRVIIAWVFVTPVSSYDDPRRESTYDYHTRTGRFNDECSITA